MGALLSSGTSSDAASDQKGSDSETTLEIPSAPAMGALLSSGTSSDAASDQKGSDSETTLLKVKEIVSSNPVVVFSKTYCGFCTRVKALLNQLGANYKVIELDKEKDGAAMQSALKEWTGQRTVPNVFIAEKQIGGCDAVTATHNQGKLVDLLYEAGAIVTTA